MQVTPNVKWCCARSAQVLSDLYVFFLKNVSTENFQLFTYKCWIEQINVEL